MANQNKTNGIFSFLYCNRIKVSKGATPILNLSLIFGILAVLTAPWLVAGGAIVALAMGYKFGFERNAAGFSSNFDEVVRGAASNVRNVVDNIVDRDDNQQTDSYYDDNDHPTL
ncbi:MAG: DUF4342 domain-containing protein [Clostridiales bacterium]|nr:DUF4342 domain-containing protein [Clostridiales bacterium]